MLVEASTTIAAEPAEVWSALTDPARRERWWPGVDLDRRAGGQLTEVWTDHDGSSKTTYGTRGRGDLVGAQAGQGQHVRHPGGDPRLHGPGGVQATFSVLPPRTTPVAGAVGEAEERSASSRSH